MTEQPESYNGQLIRDIRLDQKPYWHLSVRRMGDSKTVPVELIVNGHTVERRELVADGKVNELTFEYTPKISSWIALRIFPSCHTNPIFVEVDGKPLAPARRKRSGAATPSMSAGTRK